LAIISIEKHSSEARFPRGLKQHDTNPP
jgi:hypothetical protein